MLVQPIDDAHRWHLCVARLPHVQVLNGSKITIDQRVDAERFYLRFYAPNNGSMMCDSPERYAQLERVHGQLGALADIDLRPKRAARVRCVCAERELDTEVWHMCTLRVTTAAAAGCTIDTQCTTT
jgi:hypothetical protein